ncbi:unnamed protein product [Effrenium voratum]|nr:unnamed protein product [Effrenium voratum]
MAGCSNVGPKAPCVNKLPPVRHITSMGCLRKVSGEEVIAEAEFIQRLREHDPEDGICFFDALRRELAKRLQVPNFRQLAIACGQCTLGPDSRWDREAEYVVVLRALADADGFEDVLEAASNGDLARVIRFLERPQDPNFKNHAGRSALHVAAAHGQVDVLRHLLEAGADKDQCDNDGDTPMHFAAWQGQQGAALCLVEAGAACDKVNTFMGCVRHGVTGEEVMSKADFAAWWDEVCELRDSGVACFLDAVRRELARRLRFRNFRQLALACGQQKLGPDSGWTNAELVVVMRSYEFQGEAELQIWNWTPHRS